MFNLYLKTPADLVERSRSSVAVSLLAVTIMAILCVTEVLDFLSPPFESSLVVEPHRFGRLAVHLSLDLPHVQCKLINVELKSAIFDRKPPVDGTQHFVTKPLTGSGCRMTGSAQFDHKSSGSIQVYFATRGKNGAVTVPKEDINLSHQVRYLSFTDELEVSSETKVSGPSGGHHPMVATHGESAGQRLWEMYGPQDDQTAGMHSENNQHHDYNLQLVPTISAQGGMGYQYTWTENAYTPEPGNADKPLAVTFHYQISPMTIKWQRKEVTVMGLMMRLWSIVGGVYVMCMLLDSVLHSGKRLVFRTKAL